MSPDAGVPRVLICDDSRTFAAALERLLEHEGDLDVVGVAASAEEALAAVPRLRPQLVTMDVELPGMDGIEATRRILADHGVPVVVVSGHAPRDSERAAAALGAGALDALPKSSFRLDRPDSAAMVALRRRLARLARARPPALAGGSASTPGATRAATGADAAGRRGSVVAIGASTGGPQALLMVLSQLPADFRAPVLVVQHMSAGFTAGLVRWLDEQVALPVRMAGEGVALRRGVWFAPEDAHLVLQPSQRLALDRVTAAGPHRPAADVLLSTVARAAGRGAVGVVLTGMGRDGGEGIAAVRAAGGLTIAQDEATSAVWGMPRAAVERGAELVLPVPRIGLALRGLASAAMP